MAERDRGCVGGVAGLRRVVAAQRRRDRAAERGDVVATLEAIHDTPGRVRRGYVADRRRERGGGDLRIDAEIADRVAGGKIVPGADDDEIGTHAFGQSGQHALPRRDERFRSVPVRGQRNVHDRAARVESLLGIPAGPGIRRERVRRDEGHAVTGDRLRAVAVMIVEVDDERSAAMIRDERACGDGGVAEHAESHAARGLGMMPRRPNEGERRTVAFDGALHRRERSARGAARDGKRRRVDDRIARREIAGSRTDGPDVAFDALEIGARMHAFELAIARVARRNAVPEKTARVEICRNARDAVGRLRMPDTAQMLGVEIVVHHDHVARAVRIVSAPASPTPPLWVSPPAARCRACGAPSPLRSTAASPP